MGSNVHKLNFPPRALRHDVTDIDMAARIRRGLVTRDEMRARFESRSFAEWMKWRGVDLISHRVANFSSLDLPGQTFEDETP